MHHHRLIKTGLLSPLLLLLLLFVSPSFASLTTTTTHTSDTDSKQVSGYVQVVSWSSQTLPLPTPTTTTTLYKRDASNNHHHHHQQERQPQDAQQQQQQQQQQQPAYTPIVTAAPDSDAVLSKMGFYQTTFYACNTYPSGQQHCGWQVPILKADGAKTQIEVVVMVITCMAGMFVMALM